MGIKKNLVNQKNNQNIHLQKIKWANILRPISIIFGIILIGWVVILLTMKGIPFIANLFFPYSSVTPINSRPSPSFGEMGDMFGAINGIFSGLAFIGVIYTIMLQRKDLAGQKEELKLTRLEFQVNRITNMIYRQLERFEGKLSKIPFEVPSEIPVTHLPHPPCQFLGIKMVVPEQLNNGEMIRF